MQNVLPEAAIERFRGNLEELIPTAGARLGVAVSGGPDSLALLLLCNAAFRDQTLAATVDHRLRPESATEARYVAEICVSLGVQHTILTPSAPISGSVQAAARAARYALLEGWAAKSGITAILTAHHADDQAETLLMRLNRGAGIGGLAGVRATNGQIVRPLLNWRRRELAEIVTASGIAAVMDPSNEDERFDRARIRKAIAASDWLDPAAMARSAAALAEGDMALSWIEARLFSDRVRKTAKALCLADPLSLPNELQRRLLIRCILVLDGDWRPNGPDIQRLAETLRSGGKASIGRVIVQASPDSWEFTHAPPRRKN